MARRKPDGNPEETQTVSGITTHHYFSGRPFLNVPSLEMRAPLDASVVDPTVHAGQRPSTPSYVTPPELPRKLSAALQCMHVAAG